MRFIEVAAIILCLIAASLSTAQGDCTCGCGIPSCTCQNGGQCPASSTPSDEGLSTISIGYSEPNIAYSGPSTPISTKLPPSSPMSTIPPSTQQQLISQQAQINDISNKVDTMAQQEQDLSRRAYLYALKSMLQDIVQFMNRYLIGYY